MTNQTITVSSLGATPYIEQGFSLNGAGEPIGFLMIAALFVFIFAIAWRYNRREAVLVFGVSAVVVSWVTLALWLITGGDQS